MSAKKRLSTIFMAFVPSAIVTWAFSDNNLFDCISITDKLLFFSICVLISWVIIEILLWFWNGWFRSKFDLWREGKIKGLWKARGLKSQISKAFLDSDEVMIKVTRGYELFNEKTQASIIEDLDKISERNSGTVYIKVLLIVPCFQEKHIRKRFEDKYHGDYTQVEYLKTWYEAMKKMKEYSEKKQISINVRLYHSPHANWRYFIFKKNDNRRSFSSVFLSNYNEDKKGIDMPMYQIIKNDSNIASFLTKYFSDLWNEAITPNRLLEIIDSENCIHFICGKCKNLKCTNCICKYRAECKQLIISYEEVLKSFNA